ncbi:uncharacterized protein PGRI_093220 [Penicillium griseofulvum]|uniref:Uncharacterized protein n=1 Tax=Penicillium patulum TaxID=5078 RepID=A0A135LQS4_PENPA|nr:uncharacterized protein PGRI_093220 [Penicillium griseofulvum]KXG51310.1 hypothetical protein PGRI_093220 [Penicillium griseofulvum]
MYIGGNTIFEYTKVAMYEGYMSNRFTMELAPAYLAPPVGLRHKVTTDEGFSRRNPKDGPYGVFISLVNEGVYQAIDTGPYEHLWNRSTTFVMSLLWESNDRRKWAMEQLISMNIAIDVQNETKLKLPPGTGCIEVHNLHRAGIQLDLAVRDVKFYRSTARYEDFQRHVAKFQSKSSVSNTLDIEDGAYQQPNGQATLKPTRKAKANLRVSLGDAIHTHAKMAASQTPRPARKPVS